MSSDVESSQDPDSVHFERTKDEHGPPLWASVTSLRLSFTPPPPPPPSSSPFPSPGRRTRHFGPKPIARSWRGGEGSGALPHPVRGTTWPWCPSTQHPRQAQWTDKGLLDKKRRQKERQAGTILVPYQDNISSLTLLPAAQLTQQHTSPSCTPPQSHTISARDAQQSTCTHHAHSTLNTPIFTVSTFCL